MKRASRSSRRTSCWRRKKRCRWGAPSVGVGCRRKLCESAEVAASSCFASSVTRAWSHFWSSARASDARARRQATTAAERRGVRRMGRKTRIGSPAVNPRAVDLAGRLGTLHRLERAGGPARRKRMDSAVLVTLLGGLGLFLLGIHHLTEGMKGLAGDSLRRALQRLVAGRFSAVASGALFTAVIQSSTAAILTVIGFVSAGLVAFSQAVGMIIGATLGTTSTIWLVAIFGLRFRISAAALPLLGLGAFLWLVARGRTRSLGAILAGFGLIFTGIDYLQSGMEGISWNLEGFAGRGPGSQWILAAIGIAMSIVMQSSTAAGATTLVALNAGSLTFAQSCAMIVGQSIGTAATTGLMVLSGGLAVRRAALAHIIFSVIVGVLGMLLLGPLTAASEWVGSRLDDPDGVLALATFSSLFKLAGIVAFYPWLDRFSEVIVRISGKGSESAVGRLEPDLAGAGVA